MFPYIKTSRGTTPWNPYKTGLDDHALGRRSKRELEDRKDLAHPAWTPELGVALKYRRSSTSVLLVPVPVAIFKLLAWSTHVTNSIVSYTNEHT